MKRYVKEDNIKENILKFNNEDMKGIAKFEEKREFVNRVKKELIENAIINTVINVVKDETSLLENTSLFLELFDNLKVLTEDENFDWEAESLEEINNEAEMLSKEIYESFINLEEEDFRDFLENATDLFLDLASIELEEVSTILSVKLTETLKSERKKRKELDEIELSEKSSFGIEQKVRELSKPTYFQKLFEINSKSQLDAGLKEINNDVCLYETSCNFTLLEFLNTCKLYNFAPQK